jgi:murein DD-endopeptidase MepM/ murein hydrolase activator NlpD
VGARSVRWWGHDRRVTVRRRSAAHGEVQTTHMTRSRTLFGLLVVTLLAALVAPAGAATSDEARRAEVRAKRARANAELNTVRASESQLLKAAQQANADVAAQNRLVASARQAAAAAEAELNEANRKLDETRTKLTELNTRVVDQAVAQYISPRGAAHGLGGDTTDLAANARRDALLATVSATTADLVDQLNAAQEDFDLQAQAAKALRDKAAARKAQTETALANAKAIAATQTKLAAGVAARRAQLLGEIDAQAKADAALTARINARSRSTVVGGDSSARSGGCIWPARGSVTSEYGRRWGRLHAGIDIANSTGTPIWAAKSGVVIVAGRESGYGNAVIIDHGGGLSTLYGHMSRISVSDGQSVSQGQVVGAMGNTGNSTGTHLHFETRYGGTPRNPRGCLS